MLGLAWPLGLVPLAAYHLDENGVATTIGVAIAIIAAYLAIRHLRQLRRVHNDIRQGQAQTEALRTQMLEALKLHEVIVAHDDLKTAINHLSNEFARIYERDDPLHRRLARRDLENAAQFVRMGAEGHIVITADHFAHAENLASILLGCTDAGDEFWASSLVTPDFWAHAAAYLRQQEDAIRERGVAIHRVFVFDTQDAYEDPSAQQHMKLQVDAGIDVKYLVHPIFLAKDLVVVRKKTKLIAKPILRYIPQHRVVWRETYALECKIGEERRIDRIDLWSATDLQSEAVSKTWWALQGIFGRAKTFEPQASTP